MPRKGEIKRRELLPDPKYGDKLVTKFINNMMNRGKKSIAEGILYRSLDIIADKAKTEPLGVFKRAVDNTKPMVEVRSRRVGGATYQVPVEVRAARRETLAMRWMIDAARKRTEKTMAERLARELMEASENSGAAARRREETHRMAEANKAFAHYRW